MKIYRWIGIFLFLLSYPLYPSQQQNKMFISKFIQAENNPNYQYYSVALPRSIRATLQSRVSIIFAEQERTASALSTENFQFHIKGRYNVKQGFMHVTFSLTNLKNNKVNVIAVAKGYPDFRIFTLIDAVCKLVADTISRPESHYINETVILAIDPEGKMSVSKTDSLADLDLSYTNLQGINLSGRNLSGVNFSHADLSHADLSRANIRGTDFTGVNYRGMASFRYNLNIEKAKIERLILDEVYVHDFLLGPKIGLGISFLYGATGTLFDLISLGVETKPVPGFGYSASAMGYIFFGKLFGLYIDAGWYHFMVAEKIPPAGTILSELKMTFSLVYFQFAIGAAIRFYKWYYHLGIYSGFPLYFNHSDDLYQLKKLDFGITTAIGTRIRLALKMYLYIGLEFRLQLIRWGKSDRVINETCGGSTMSIFVNTSLLFGLK